MNRTTGIPRARKLMPSDRSGRDLLNVGVLTTADGSCRDNRGIMSGWVPAGVQTLPKLTCPPTWPAGRFDGARLIRDESFISFALTGEGSADPFAFWRVPDNLRSDKYLGNDQLYGEFADWTVDLRAQYGAVLPGGTGDPTLDGFPLGITVAFNAFYYTLPTINNTFFWRATVVNESYKLYGDGVNPATGVDYDSLYMGINPIRLFPSTNNYGYEFQYAAQYLDPKRNAVMMNKCGAAGVRNNAKDSPYYGSAAGCAAEPVTGFDAGGMAVVFLRSPLGDSRNKWLSNPGSPFYNPAHAKADDTLTINRTSACGFNNCHLGAQAYSERAYFGLVAGITQDWLAGRSRNDFTDDQYWNTVHPANWPTRGDFNVWVPGNWDYRNDGTQGDVRAESCRGAGPNGCVALWSDTLPGGFLNTGGQFPHWGVGPVALRSGDTTSFLIAFVWDADSASIETQVNNVVDFYMNFYFGPEEAPPPTIFASAEGGVASNVATAAGSVREARATLVWKDMGDYRDRYVEDVYRRLLEAPVGTPLGNIRVLNRWVVDSLEARITNNLAAVYVFKSCDGGATFTATADCFGNRVPAGDPSSKWRNHGWLPYAQLAPSVGRFTDGSVQPGIQHFYSLVTENRGAIFNVYTGSVVAEQPPGSGHYVCLSADCAVQRFEFAPPIISPLKTTPGGSAASVYIPLSRPAGYVAPRVQITLPEDRTLPPLGTTVMDAAPAGRFTAFFADSVQVVEIHRMRGREDLGYATTARLFTIRNVHNPATGQTTRRVIAERQLSGATQFAENGARSVTSHTVVEDGVTMVIRDIAFSGLSMVLARDGAAPIMGTSQFVAGRTTPNALVESREFPGFLLEIAGDQQGTFRSHLATTAQGDTLSGAAVATSIVRWLHTGATNLAGTFSQYQVEWLDHPFGPGRQFIVSGRDPTDAFLASVGKRNDPEKSVTDAGAVAALQAAGIKVTSLREYSLPFRIRNLTTGEPVQVAVINHLESTRLGVDADTFRIDLPANRWLPGDRLVLLERIPMDSTVQGGIVLDGAGRPIQVRPLKASFAVTLGCGAAGFEQCNPVPNGDYLSLAPGSRVVTTYSGRLTSDITLGLEVFPAVMPRSDPTTRVDLSRVAVVPNPYVVYSRFERSADEVVLKFTNLPPSGTIHVYTVGGQLVQRISYTEADLQGSSGDLPWNMVTRENFELSYGLYIFVLESEFGRTSGKFVVIR